MKIVNTLLGKDDRFIDYHSFECPVHCEIVADLVKFKQDAATNGVTLSLASGYRSFGRQLAIWNAKASGLKPVYDSDGKPLDIKRLSKVDLMFSILRWSALPGTSRHHWGTDVDIYDASAMPPGYQLQLSSEEAQRGGVFEHLYEWLEAYLLLQASIFYRPYNEDLGGVAPEPWHLSYMPVAESYKDLLNIEDLIESIKHENILLKDEVLANIDFIFENYVNNVCLPNWSA
ncbi:MAG: peptidase [Alteromonadaceae bacterium]|nr:MAG: peptidase [Alteromonadaceae bacterium]